MGRARVTLSKSDVLALVALTRTMEIEIRSQHLEALRKGGATRVWWTLPVLKP